MRETKDQQQVSVFSSDEQKFLTAVRDSIAKANPKFGDESSLLPRVTEAYREAKRLGLTHGDLLRDFICLELQVKGFSRQPEIAAWLEKPGAPIEDRLQDLLDVLRKKLAQEDS